MKHLTILFFFLAALQAAASTVALLGRGEAGRNLADRIFAAGSEFEFVERDRIQAVLQERKLSGDKLDSAAVRRLAPLLKADLFVLVPADKEEARARLLIFEPFNGFRLADELLPAENPEQAAAELHPEFEVRQLYPAASSPAHLMTPVAGAAQGADGSVWLLKRSNALTLHRIAPASGANARIHAITDRQVMTRNMELELRNLKLTGPGEIALPPKSTTAPKPPAKRTETAKPANPCNQFDARPMLKSGSMRTILFPPAERLTHEQLIRLNPDFSIRPIFRYPSEQEHKYSRKLRFPPAVSGRGPFAAATVYDGKFYGICRNGKQSELCEFDLSSGKWRTLWRNTAPESIDQYPYGNGNVPLLHTGAVIWSGYGGIPANGGAPAPLPDFFRRPGTYALLGRQFYAAGPGPGQLLKFKPNGRPDQPLELNRQGLPSDRFEGIWSYPDSRTLLAQAGSYLYEIQPATGAVRRKLQFHGIPRIIDTPLGHILTSRQDYPALLAIDGGPGQSFLLIAGPPNFVPGMRVLPGAADRNLSPKLKPLGLKGQYLLLQDECHRLLLVNLVRPERSLMLRGIGFGRFHLSPDGNALWLEGEDALYEIAPRGGWGRRSDSQERITAEDFRLEQLGAERLDPEQALLQSFASDADLFRMRPVLQDKRQVLEFTAAKVPFECRVSLQFNPELTAGKSLRLFFKPEKLARQLPALRVGEGADSGISPLAADGTVTLRSGSGLVELILEKSDKPVTFTIDTILVSKGKEFRR